jgi:hypothetical protein
MAVPSGFERSYATGYIADFKQRLADNLLRLAEERTEREFAVPVALFLLVDEANGGDASANEVVKRFALLDAESRNVIDFFFLGWRAGSDGVLTFDLSAFAQSRDTLRRLGVTRFGGNADLFVLDVWLREDRVELDFKHAIYVDLASAKAKGNITTIGSFLEGLIAAAETIRSSGAAGSAVLRISDQLGLASAKQSLLDFVLDKWGKVFGATKLAELVTRDVGPTIDLARL